MSQVVLVNEINDLKDFAREAFGSCGSGFYTDKISIAPYSHRQNQNDVAAASSTTTTYYFGMNEANSLATAFTQFPTLYYGYFHFSVYPSAFTAGTLNLYGGLQQNRIDGASIGMGLPFGSASRLPDTGAPMALTALSQFNYLTPVPVLANTAFITVGQVVATWTLGVYIQFSGFRFQAC